MSKVSINEIVGLTGQTRATVIKRLEGHRFAPGPKQAKLYEHAQIFQWRSASGEADEKEVTEAESRRLLNLERIEGQRLENENKRKERIPLEIVEAINDRVFSNLAGMLKTNRGKLLSDDVINDMLTEARSIGAKLKEANG